MAELSTEIPWFLLQILLHITNIINCLIYVLLLPSLSHKGTLFHLYKLRMNNLFCYFNFVGYFLFLGGGWQILVPSSIFNLTVLTNRPLHTFQSSGHHPLPCSLHHSWVFLMWKMHEHFALPAPTLLRSVTYNKKSSWDKGTSFPQFLSQKGDQSWASNSLTPAGSSSQTCTL